MVAQLRQSAAAAVLGCLAAGRPALLADGVFPLCREAGAVGPLVEAVEVSGGAEGAGSWAAGDRGAAVVRGQWYGGS